MASSLQSFKDKSLQKHHFFAADLSNQKEIKKLLRKIKSKTRTLDVLVNNVGFFTSKKFEKMSEDEINYFIDLNLKSHLFVTKGLLPLLKKSRNPQIIFMSSMAAKFTVIGESVYCATKAAITNFAQALRNELRGKMKVSIIHSWGVNTWGAEDDKTLLKPENIAEIVEFIITREKKFVIESIDVGSLHQWRAGEAPWSPK